MEILKSELDKCEKTALEKSENLKSCEQAIAKLKSLSGHLRIEVQQADTRVDELQDALDADSIEEGRLDALKVQLAEAEDDEKFQKESYGESVIAKDISNESMKSTRTELAAFDDQITDAEATLKREESKVANCSNQRLAALREKNAALEAVEKEKTEREEIERERQAQVKVVGSFTAQATRHCARVPVDEGETGDSIELKFEKLQKDLAAAERRLVFILWKCQYLISMI